jgi:hypothetical protein
MNLAWDTGVGDTGESMRIDFREIDTRWAKCVTIGGTQSLDRFQARCMWKMSVKFTLILEVRS